MTFEERIQELDKLEEERDQLREFIDTELVAFGYYLLSEERTNRIKANYKIGDAITLEERLACVYDADVRNWKEIRRRYIEI